MQKYISYFIKITKLFQLIVPYLLFKNCYHSHHFLSYSSLLHLKHIYYINIISNLMYVHLLLKKKKKKKRGTRRKENHASHRHPQLSRSCTSHDRVRENTDSDGVVRHPAGSGGIERGVEGRRIDVLVTNQRQNQKYVPAVPRSNYGKLAGVKRRGGGEQAAGTYIEDGVSVAEVGRGRGET